MENKKMLNEKDGWEEIINNPERQKRIETSYKEMEIRKLDKILNKAVLVGCLGGVASMLGFFGVLYSWLAFPLAGMMICRSCYMFGVWHGRVGWRADQWQ